MKVEASAGAKRLLAMSRWIDDKLVLYTIMEYFITYMENGWKPRQTHLYQLVAEPLIILTCRLCDICSTGIGYGMVLISGIVCIYYNIIIAWTLYYLFTSFQRVLPWSTCDNSWNTDACASRSRNGSISGNLTANWTRADNVTGYQADRDWDTENITMSLKKKTPSEEFWQWV